MAEAKKTYTDAQFTKPGSSFPVLIIMLFLAFAPYVYTDKGAPRDFQNIAQSFGNFLQLLLVLFVLNTLSEVLLFSVHGIFFPSKKGNRDFGQRLSLFKLFSSGTFKGICPYCGAPKDVSASQDEFLGIDCPKCKNRFLLRDGKFFQPDPPSPLDARFSGIRNGLGLVQIASVATFLAPAIVILEVILATLALNLLRISISDFISDVSVFLLIVSVAVQIAGMRECLQAPDWSPRNPAKTWIIAAMCLQVITLMLLIAKLLTLNQSNTFLLNALLGISGFLCQFAFFVFLIRFCSFTQRADLRDEFWRLLADLTTLTILLLFGPLAELVLPASYKTPLLVLTDLLACSVFLRYFSCLGRLNSHISQALATYNYYGASSRN